MTSAITFVPLGGLCNRMRAIASGVHLAKEKGSDIIIYWHKNRDCFAHFSELFQPIENKQVQVKPYTFREFYLAVNRKKNLCIPGLIRGFIFDNQIVGQYECLEEAFPEKFPGKNIFITSGYSLTKHEPLKDLFVPIPELQNRVNSILARFTGNVIGIHIRRGDNLQSIGKNTVEDYCRYIESELCENPGIQFYLATDSPEVKKELIQRFKKNILFNEGLMQRDSLTGMKDAVVDLWCLSRTTKIVGSYYSSFSDLAAEMGGIPLIILE